MLKKQIESRGQRIVSRLEGSVAPNQWRKCETNWDFDAGAKDDQ